MLAAEDKYSFSKPLAQVEHRPQVVPTFNVLRKSFIEQTPVLVACLISLSVTSLQIQTYMADSNNL